MIHRFLLALLVIPAPAFAQAPIKLDYDAYAAGLNVLVMKASADFRPDRYRIDPSYRTTGLLGLFVSSEVSSTVIGRWAGLRPVPERFLSTGSLRGQPRRTVLDYRDGQPEIAVLDPPNDTEREAVSVEAQRGTIDTISALAMLVRQVTETGRCDGTARVYDGRRLSQITARTVGEEMLPPYSRTIYSGRALHCDFSGVQTGGFMRGEDRAGQVKPHEGSAWLARVLPGQPMLPVRMVFDIRLFGQASMFLTAAGQDPSVSSATGSAAAPAPQPR